MSEHEHHKHKHQDKGSDHAHGSPRAFFVRFIVSLVLTVPVFLYSDFGKLIIRTELPRFYGVDWVLLAISAVVVLWGGWPFIRGTFLDIKKRRAGMNALVSVALLSGLSYSVLAVIKGIPNYNEAITTLTVFILLGHYLEARVSSRTDRLLKDLAKLLPDIAHLVLDNDEVQDVRAEHLKPGQIVLVKPGEAFPCDGKVIEAQGYVDESSLTGESLPVKKGPGDQVSAGTLNLDHALKVEVTNAGPDTVMAGVIEMVSEIKRTKTPSQRIADRLAQYLTILALLAGTITLLVWWLGINSSFIYGLSFAISVMIITCPHALGLAVPTVVSVLSGLAAKKGILLKDPGVSEAINRAKVVVFDKTGTLTTGKLSVSDVIVNGISESRALKMAGSLESYSTHPIGKAIAEAAGELPPAEEVEEYPGMGIKGKIDGKTVAVGNLSFMKDIGADVNWAAARAKQLASQGKKVIFLAVDSKVLAVLAFSDTVRPSSAKALAKLRELGYKTMILSGDQHETVARVAQELGADDFKAGVLPGDKAKIISDLRDEIGPVVMVGDGVNDAPALSAADVGVAMGAGTRIAGEAGSVILVKDDPMDLVRLFKLSKASVKKMRQNFVWATGYNVVAIPIAGGALASLGIVIRPEMSALIMSLSSIIVVLNALTLLRTRS